MSRRGNLFSGRLDRGRRSPSIYSRTENVAEKKPHKILFSFVSLFFVAGAAYLVLFSPFVRITEIEVTGTKFLSVNDIKKDAQSYISGNILNNNLITIYSGGLSDAVGKKDGIKSVDVKRVWPHKIVLAVVEKNPILTWETMGKKYMIDENGTVVEEYQDKYKDFPTVTDTKNVPVNVGKQILPSSFVTFVKDLGNSFSTYTAAKMTKLEVPEVTSEVKVSSDAGWYALFDTTRSAKGELVSLSRVINETKAKSRKLEYIDLRVDNRIFYK